ncbi:glutamyl-tRNA(Gln) amidotransferase subunit A, mitochondrial-like isoform X2 [Apostichopus japonicus]|uniref:glutamyl-tRNA(Gln) amidotransferase subunit A, mitochondrial-like isoform X2 n=1 Tax=Stichopus japonicus TaxID=307972 RepID=UPI003AB70EC7
MLRLGIRELAKELRSGEVSVSELCNRCKERASKLNSLNALVTTTFEQAEKHALESNQRIQSGNARHILDGIPFAVKDNFSTKGIRTTCASKILQNYIPAYTATVVEKLEECGAILMGKANLDEFAMGSGCTDSIFGPTRNPWLYPYKEREVTGQRSDTQEVQDTDWFISGGSSGGSAVAVATGMVLGALGSDTGGSTRMPASICGVVGLKPTYGLSSRHGLIPLVNSVDVPGVLSKTVDDAAVILGAMCGADPLDSTTVSLPDQSFQLPDEIDIKGLKVGIPQEYHSPRLEEEVLQSWSKAADLFENAGAKVIPVSLPHTQYSIACYSVLCAVEVASNMARYDGIEFGHRSQDHSSTEALYAASRHEGFNQVVRGRIFAGNFFLLRRNYKEFFQHAQKLRRLITRDFNEAFQEVDILLTPTTECESLTYAEYRQEDNRTHCETLDVYTQPSNLAGVPALSLPSYLSSKGLPIGLQMIAPCFQDKKLLTVAKWLEQQVAFPMNILHSQIESFLLGR